MVNSVSQLKSRKATVPVLWCNLSQTYDFIKNLILRLFK